MDAPWNPVFGFVSLLLFPLLGLLMMLKRRASPLLLCCVIAWVALGALALAADWHPRLTREELLHGWCVGAALGAAFLAIDWLRRRRRIAKWLRIALASVTVCVFVKALVDFFQRYG